MNCPGGLLVYKQGIKSYRDLPLRVAEFGMVNRYEASGSLMGLMRVREFTQDDAHIFCTPEQMEEECVKTIKLILDIYKDFGFEDVKIYLSTRPDSIYRIGSDEIWDISEKPWPMLWSTTATNMKSTKAKARSTVRSWNSFCATPSAANGSAAPFRWT